MKSITTIIAISLFSLLPVTFVQGQGSPKSAASEKRPAPAGAGKRTDVYHVHFTKAALGKAVQLGDWLDRKSTRLNSSHRTISYAVFCLKKKNNYCLRLQYALHILSRLHITILFFHTQHRTISHLRHHLSILHTLRFLSLYNHIFVTVST